MLAICATPVGFVWTMPLWLKWQAVLPPVFEPSGDPTAVVELLGNLSLSLSSIAIASVVGAAVILKDRGAAQARFYPIILSAIAVAMCLLAVFAGFRFQLALAEQISLYRLDMERIQDRLECQAVATLLCSSSIITLAVDSFILNIPPRSASRTKAKPTPKRSPKKPVGNDA